MASQLGGRRALLVGAVLMALLAACGDDGDAATTAATTTSTVAPTVPESTTVTSSSTLEQMFVSDRYGFSVGVPEGWSATDATFDWSGITLGGLGSPVFASVADPALSRYFVVAAAPVADGMELAEWQAKMDRAAPPVCGDPSPVEETTLGGEPALAWTHGCGDGYDVTKLAALHEGLGYIVFLASTSANDNAEDRQIFELLRSSFSFTS